MRMGRVILSNYADTPQLEELCLLRPYEAVIYQISGKKENIKIPMLFVDWKARVFVLNKKLGKEAWKMNIVYEEKSRYCQSV